MTTDRLDEIIKGTAYPDSNSVYQAVYQVENEMQQEFNSRTCENCKHGTEEDGPTYDCYMSRNYFGYDHVALPIDYGCTKFKRKEV